MLNFAGSGLWFECDDTVAEAGRGAGGGGRVGELKDGVDGQHQVGEHGELNPGNKLTKNQTCTNKLSPIHLIPEPTEATEGVP